MLALCVTMRHPTDGMNEIATVEILESILIGIMHVGTTIELVSGWVFHPILITSILGWHQDMCNNEDKRLT